MKPNIPTLQKAYQVLRALFATGGQPILNLLSEKGEMDVTGIYTELKMEQPICSRYLACLRGVDLVKTRREGKRVIYSINTNQIEKINSAAALLNDWKTE